MPDKRLHLITTADERTWRFNEPVIFLGEWCRHYARKHIWAEIDAVVAKPYGLGKKQKDQDYMYTLALEEDLIQVIQKILNEYHDTNHSLRYWRILVGHWLHHYVNIVFNRYKTIKQCLNSYPITGITLFDCRSSHLVTQDSLSFIRASNDSVWNAILDSYIFQYTNSNCIDIEYHTLNNWSYSYVKWNEFRNKRIDKRIQWYIYQCFDRLTNFFVKQQDAFLITSYLPVIEEVKLHLSLGQTPKIWRSLQAEHFTEPNLALREQLSQYITLKRKDVFHQCAHQLLFRLLPVCYLEGFNDLRAKTEKLPWPSKPQFIFTSNSFATDEVFKFWTATKTEQKTPYFTGQHGNCYGTYQYANPTIEESTADKFLTWGWTDNLPQHTPAFIFKTAGKKRLSYDPQGHLTLIEFSSPNRFYRWDAYAEFQDYFDNQKIFVSSLSKACQDALIIRLPTRHRYHDWSEQKRWRDFNSHLNVDTGDKPIRRLIEISRLVVYSYDSTGVLETLSENIPTLAFWDNGLEHLRDSALPYYQLLIDAGIVHLSAESTAQKVNAIWDNVCDWWYGKQVQDARRKFCDRYARTSRNPAKDLKRILTKP